MPGYPLIVLTPVFGLAVYCLTHLAACRLGRRQNAYFPLIAGFAIGLLTVIGLGAVALTRLELPIADRLSLLGLSLVAYLALSFGYFNFVNMNLTSLRIRMLLELRDAGGDLSEERLASCYNTDQVIALRMARLIRGGHLVERDGRLTVGKRRFLFLARCFDVLRQVILGTCPPQAVRPPTNL